MAYTPLLLFPNCIIMSVLVFVAMYACRVRMKFLGLAVAMRCLLNETTRLPCESGGR